MQGSAESLRMLAAALENFTDQAVALEEEDEHEEGRTPSAM